MIKKEQKPILITLLVVLALFTTIFVQRENYEFIMYEGVIIFFMALILLTNKTINYSKSTLWGLTLWATMHLSGGGILINGKRLYELIIIPLTPSVFRYDQLVHIIGFGVATIVAYELIAPAVKIKKARFYFVTAMAGLGLGALNEIIEFIATVIMPQTGVGGYYNTGLDLIADLIGTIIAIIYLKRKK